jgi:DNA-binding transcriptional MocR family regulator
LRTHLPEWTWPEPDGGLTLWVRLPGAAAPADSGAFAQAALRHGVAVVPGRLLSAGAGAAADYREGASQYLRLAFTQPPDVLARSAVALARASGSRLRCAAYTRAVPISPFLVTSAASSSAASPPVPAGRDGRTM